MLTDASTDCGWEREYQVHQCWCGAKALNWLTANALWCILYLTKHILKYHVQSFSVNFPIKCSGATKSNFKETTERKAVKEKKCLEYAA
jgi:hypothetical protein